MTEVWPGRPFPLGATWDAQGTNFSLFSEHAESVELCLFSESGRETRIPVTQRQAMNWHCYLPGVGPGQRYGYRVYGPFDPEHGHRFNPAKLLIDPYAKSIEGVIDFAVDANVLPYVPNGGENDDLELDDEDDAQAVPKSVVTDPDFDWEGDEPLRIPFADTVIYETHVRGFTMTHPDVREDLRGTYAGPRLRAGARIPQGPRASRPSSCCPSTTSQTSPSWSIAASPTTGATARSATWRRTPSTPPPAVSVSRYVSSRAW